MTLAEPPRIFAIFEWKQRRPNSIAIDVTYRHVQIVCPGEAPVKYSSGNFRKDIAEARSNGHGQIANLQEHQSVALCEKLLASKPEERYELLNERRSIGNPSFSG
jgi:hypothetical protein